MNEIVVAKHLALDGPPPIWGWELPVDLFLAQTAAGVLLVTALGVWWAGPPRSAALRWARFAPAALLAGALGALFLDLACKPHFWRFFAVVRPSSPMSLGAWILLLSYVVGFVWAMAGLDDAQAAFVARFWDRLRLGGAVRTTRRLALAHERKVRVAALASAVALGGYSGVLLSLMTARPLWNSTLVGPILLASGVATGTALMLLFRVDPAEQAWLERVLLWAVGVEAALIVGCGVGLAHGGSAARAAVDCVAVGRFAPAFWALVVAAGLAVPVLLQVEARRLRVRPTLVAPVLVLLGGLALRWILIVAGQA
ncbi:MAG TPA: NrfD/PsrC family molybdoenzyme membrane anchor subunit [Anaeromyxobacter sp.]|nr:NrfD/PsrC family molybdoenzyme membrane anchor subunit [Anaeromyxobacter sp.]